MGSNHMMVQEVNINNILFLLIFGFYIMLKKRHKMPYDWNTERHPLRRVVYTYLIIIICTWKLLKYCLKWKIIFQLILIQINRSCYTFEPCLYNRFSVLNDCYFCCLQIESTCFVRSIEHRCDLYDVYKSLAGDEWKFHREEKKEISSF